MKDIDGITLAEFILASYPDKGITPMKMQKLAYYAKVWSVVAGEHFISAQFEKWDYGPVNPEIYHKYKHYGKNVIKDDSISSSNIDGEKAKLLKFILNNYVNYSALSLSAMTHNEDPWENAAPNSVITNQAIVEYYSKQPFAQNFTKKISAEDPFHLLQSDSWHAFTLDMEPEEAAAFQACASYNKFQESSLKAESDFDELIKNLLN